MNYTYYIPLKFEKIYPEKPKYTEEQFNHSRKLLKQFEKHEVFLKKNAEAKNELESYIYVINDAKNDEDFLKYIREHELKKVVQLAEEFDDWLYTEEASKSNFTTFNANYNQMYSIYSKVIARKKEWENRPLLLDNLKTSIDTLEKNITDMTSSMPWVNETQKKEGNELLEILKGFQASIELDLQENKLQQDVNVKEKIVETKVQALEAEIEKLRLIKKPAKSEKAPKTKRKKPQANTTTTENDTNKTLSEDENITLQIENENLNETEDKIRENNASEQQEQEAQKDEDTHEEL